MNRASNGRIRLYAHDTAEATANILEIDHLAAGWNIATNDLVTDPLRVVWNVRKTRESGYYRISASLENLNPSNASATATSTVYIQKPDAYAASSSSFVMGHAQSAAYNKSGTAFDMVDISIDNLSFVETSGVDPVLFAPVVGVVDGNAFVDLAWNKVVEADGYEVKRSDTGIGGPYVTKVSGLTTNGWQDTAVINGEEYYYIVTAGAADAADVESSPVAGTPDVAATGVFLDTSFTGTEGYEMGDLAGQQRWKAITNSAPNAFYVNTNGNGYAENETYSNLVSSTAAQVYFNKITSNGVGHAWSGTVDFSLAAVANGGFQTNTYTPIIGTNSVTVTNIQPVANLTGNEVLAFGISSDVQNSDLQPKGDGDGLINVRYTGAGDVTFGLNQYNGTANQMLSLTRAQVGWDPQWQDLPAS